MARRKSRRRKRRKKGKQWLSLDALKDVGLVIVALGGFLTGLAMLSQQRSPLIERWLNFLEQMFGQGVYVLPVALTVGGIWLIIRRLDKNSSLLPTERLFGLLCLFLAGLGWLDWLTPLEADVTIWSGGRGGIIGAGIRQGFHTAVGEIGTPILLAGVVVIGALLTLHISFRDLIDWYAALHHEAVQRIPLSLPAPRDIRTSLTKWYHNVRAWMSSFQAPSAPTFLSSARLSTEKTQEPAPTHYEPRWELPDWREILDDGDDDIFDAQDIRHKTQTIEETLSHFNVPAKVVEVTHGPRVTRFGVEPGYKEKKVRGEIRRRKVKVRTITGLSDDLALALEAKRIRIEAPVPGRPIVGIEVPNPNPEWVSLKSVMETDAYENLSRPLPVALGRDVGGAPVVASLAKMPHLLIAGATGSGKSVCINSIIACLLCHHTPDQLQLLMIDPKMVELVGYRGIPHLTKPVITDLDHVVDALRWSVKEMQRRYVLFSAVGARNLPAYNQQAIAKGETPLPYTVIVVDELADLMMIAPEEVENHICRLAQMARATGIHLIIATQRPSVDVVTGLIKANFPARIAFAVSSQVDSRVILDKVGAETLLGQGDMLYLASDAGIPKRAQGCFVSDQELNRLIRYWRLAQPVRPTVTRTPRPQEPADRVPDGSLEQQQLWDEKDSLLPKARELAEDHYTLSEQLLTRQLRIGEARAAKLINLLAAEGVIDPETNRSKIRRSR